MTATATQSVNGTDRRAQGRAARQRVSRGHQGTWAPPAGRRDPIEVLTPQEETRLPELVPIRHGRMLESPFAFFRGAAAMMAADLGAAPDSGLRVQLCGDAHLSNFGAFAAPDRTLVFDVNDFDETLPGPFEWDVKRLAASVEIAARERTFGRRDRTAAVLATVRSYREAMRGFARQTNLAVWYARLDERDLEDIARLGGASAGERDRVRRNARKARSKDSLRALRRLTHEVDGAPRIVSDPPLIVPVDELAPPAERADLEQAMRADLATYRRSLTGAARHLVEQYRFVDMARKVVGVGSVGTRAWIVFMLGRDEGDPLFLQVKEAEASVLEPYAGRSRYAQHGRRVVEGQWLMQAASDVFLGWVTVTGIDGMRRAFYVRQLWDWKRSAEVESMGPELLAAYGRMCGWTLARAHARSGDPVAIAAYLGGSGRFERALAAYAAAYADQNERDHEAFARAVSEDRVEARTGL